MMTMVTLLTANITPTIIPTLELLEELLTGIEDEVAEVDIAMPIVVECVSDTLVVLIEVVVTVVLLSLEAQVHG